MRRIGGIGYHQWHGLALLLANAYYLTGYGNAYLSFQPFDGWPTSRIVVDENHVAAYNGTNMAHGRPTSRRFLRIDKDSM
jgi:hypothetical protein